MYRNLLILPVVLLLGCSTLNSPTTEKRIATSCKAAAYLGSAEYLRVHPESRPKFVAARDALNVLELSEQVDWVTLLAIVQSLPVKEIHSERATLIITAATILLSDYAGSLPLERQGELKVFAAALRQGIDLALAQK